MGLSPEQMNTLCVAFLVLYQILALSVITQFEPKAKFLIKDFLPYGGNCEAKFKKYKIEDLPSTKQYWDNDNAEIRKDK